MPRTVRRGFTAIEVLVVISIIGLLFSLLLPAVQSARESARRSACQNNLKQIGLALASYTGIYSTFPTDITDFSHIPSNVPPGNGPPPFSSSLTRLLPFLEQTNLFNTINYDLEAYAGNGTGGVNLANLTCSRQQVAVFLCPSDTFDRTSGPGNSYRGNYGVGPALGTTIETIDSGTGIFAALETIYLSSVSDGLSRTAAYAERLRGSQAVKGGDPTRDLGNLGQCPDAVIRDADYALACCQVASSKNFPATSTSGASWFLSGMLNTAYCHAQEPNGAIVDGIDLGYYPSFGVVTARSLHGAGANVVMADGSVRFVTRQIARPVWRALGTRNGGELVE